MLVKITDNTIHIVLNDPPKRQQGVMLGTSTVVPG